MRKLTKDETDLIKEIDEVAIQLKEVHLKVLRHLLYQKKLSQSNMKLFDRMADAMPHFWLDQGRGHLQMGLMALKRTVEQPGTF